jgi:hypothetical protein
MRYRSKVAVGSPTVRMTAVAAVTMLAAILGAGALVAGAQPSPSPAPPELPTAMRPAWVTGVARYPSGQRIQQTRVVDGVESDFEVWTDIPIEMSDPRLSGTLSQVTATAEHPVADDVPIVVFTGEYRIENEGGSWEGAQVAVERGLFRTGGNTTVADTGVLVGSGAYEGLSAFLVLDYDGSPPVTVTAAIFPGRLPPMITFEDLPQ